MNQILIGIGAGISLALTGFGKSKGESFDWTKFGTTIVIGAISGIVYSVLNIPLNDVNSYLTQLGVVELVERGIKTIWRRFLGK